MTRVIYSSAFPSTRKRSENSEQELCHGLAEDRHRDSANAPTQKMRDRARTMMETLTRRTADVAAGHLASSDAINTRIESDPSSRPEVLAELRLELASSREEYERLLHAPEPRLTWRYSSPNVERMDSFLASLVRETQRVRGPLNWIAGRGQRDAWLGRSSTVGDLPHCGARFAAFHECAPTLGICTPLHLESLRVSRSTTASKSRPSGDSFR